MLIDPRGDLQFSVSFGMANNAEAHTRSISRKNMIVYMRAHMQTSRVRIHFKEEDGFSPEDNLVHCYILDLLNSVKNYQHLGSIWFIPHMRYELEVVNPRYVVSTRACINRDRKSFILENNLAGPEPLFAVEELPK